VCQADTVYLRWMRTRVQTGREESIVKRRHNTWGEGRLPDLPAPPWLLQVLLEEAEAQRSGQVAAPPEEAALLWYANGPASWKDRSPAY
jgi:hypothetical protein